MTDLDVLQQRHEQFIADGFIADLPLPPALRALVVTCVDPRVEPAAVLGLRSGDAAVVRNIGGRITEATLVQLRLLSGLGGPSDPDQRAELIVMQHTGCGITRMAQHPEALAPYFGVSPDDLPIKQILDPRASIRADLATLEADARITTTFRPVGLLYDLTTGALDEVGA